MLAQKIIRDQNDAKEGKRNAPNAPTQHDEDGDCDDGHPGVKGLEKKEALLNFQVDDRKLPRHIQNRSPQSAIGNKAQGR